MKDLKDFYEQFDECRERDIPMCADACPFKIDILDIQERITKKRFNAAYKSIRDGVAFPEIVSEICPAYCESACIRSIIDEPLRIKLLEKTLIAKANRKDPNKYNLPAKKERIAVIGAGLSGMGFAARMASRKYGVTVFEKTDKIGGQLKELMDEEKYMAEFDLQLQFEKIDYELNTEVTDLSELAGEFTVIYVATGDGGNCFDIPLPEEIEDEKGEKFVRGGCLEIGETGVFIGGSVCGLDAMNALACGLNMATSAENYLKVKKLEYPVNQAPTRCVPNKLKLVEAPAVEPAEEVFSEEECIKEAERCIKCQCDACDSYCDIVGFYQKWPVKMRDEIFLSVKPAGSLVHKCPARKYIAACTDCEIMKDTCAGGIDLCGMVKAARHQMIEADKMPAGFAQYFLRDMEFANGEFAAVKKNHGNSQDNSPCEYAFFPGCNLGALDPDYVIKPYKWLLSQIPDAGLLLRCCGVPCDWSGNGQMHQEEIDKLRQDWMDMGKPVLITACLSCEKHIHEYLPEIETKTIYELMAEKGVNAECSCDDTVYSVFDPCSARNNEDVQDAIRNLATNAGVCLEELPEGAKHGCCGFGGQGVLAAGDFAKYVADKRSGLSENPYLVYCSNCRDVFTGNSKPAIHIFDVLFNINMDNAKAAPDVTERRTNRVTLKERLLNEIWGEQMNTKPENVEYTLVMDDELAAKVNRQKLLAEDICKVIRHAEDTGRRTINPADNHYKAYLEIGAITVWVEYTLDSEDSDVRRLHNVYSHRMQIQLEAVFNGKKIDE